MKKNYHFTLWYLGIIILFSCLIIFNITSLTLIPGDFGSANSGPPDGCVDFEDLMIFAMAYGSTPSDANWNPLCDIAGLGGSLTPDGVIDFEDLMIFAMHYGECSTDTYTLTTSVTPSDSGYITLNPSGGTYAAGTQVTLTANPESGYYCFDHWGGDVSGSSNPIIITMDANKSVTAYFVPCNGVTGVYAAAITYHATSMGKVQPKLDELFEKRKLKYAIRVPEPREATKGDIAYGVAIAWDEYEGASVYRIYRRVNGGSFSIIAEPIVTPGEGYYEYPDIDVSPGNVYTYYVTALVNSTETPPSRYASTQHLPSCSLSSPANGSSISNPNQTFSWSPVGIISFPYGPISSEESDLWIYDQTASKNSWWPFFADMTTSSANYNQDGQAIDLVDGHQYTWDSWGYGYDTDGYLNAISMSEDWGFVYNDGGSDTRIIRLEGNLSFGDVNVGDSAQGTLTIYNDGNSTLTVSSISYPTGFSGNWSGTISAGSSHNVTVTFSPAQAITYSGTLTVNSNATSGTNTKSVSGTGIGTRIINLSGDLSFGDVYVNDTSTKILTISNTGTSTLHVISIDYPTGFSGNWNGDISAGSSHNVTVTFSPTEVKTYSDSLTVNSNATSGTNTKSVSGTGIEIPDTIQGMIDAASDGDIITLEAKTYYESGIIFPNDRKIILQGANLNNPLATVVDGGGENTVFILENVPDGTIIQGITIQNGSGDSTGGISIINGSPVITGNNIYNNIGRAGGGIRVKLETNGTVYISNNNISQNGGEQGGGVGLLNSEGGGIINFNNNIVSNNSLIDFTTSDDLGAGILAICYSNDGTINIKGNDIFDNNGEGLFILTSDGNVNVTEGNDVYNNDYCGIVIYRQGGNIDIFSNTINNNSNNNNSNNNYNTGGVYNAYGFSTFTNIGSGGMENTICGNKVNGVATETNQVYPNNYPDNFISAVCGSSTNHPPEIISIPITTATVNKPYSYDVDATDPDVGDTLTYSLTTKPSGMSINSSTGVINWTPSSDQVGDNSVTVKVSDNGSPVESDTQSFVIEVGTAPPDPPDPPQLSDPGDSVWSNEDYTISWSDESSSGATKYCLRESGVNDENFNNYTDYTIDGGHNTSKVLHHSVASSDITYYYKVRAETSDSNIHSNWEDSNIVSIVIKAKSIPAVSTQDASGIEKYSVVGNGNLVNINGSECTELGFEIGESQSNYELKLCSGSSFNTGSYSLKIEGLKEDTKYYIRAYASNGTYIGRGNWKEFRTLPDPVVYRAFLVGANGTAFFDSVAPYNSVHHLYSILDHSNFYCSISHNDIITGSDATKENILQGINSHFYGADNNDISCFYFAGHGARSGNISYLCPYDFDGYTSTAISISELETYLNNAPGIKVVFLDCCAAGGFINKANSENKFSDDEYVNFNNDVINIFSTANSKYLTDSNQYRVLTAVRRDEIAHSNEFTLYPYMLFTEALCQGCGYDYYTYPYWADNNGDRKISLQEACTYSQYWLDNEFPSKVQNVQIFPEGSNFPIIEY